MSARLLDGQAVAAAIRESVLPDVHAFTAAAGRPPGLGIVLVGDDPGVRDLRPQQGAGGHRVRPLGGPAAAAGDGIARRAAGARAASSTTASVTTASSCSRRCRRRWGRARRSRCSTRSIRPRTSTASIRSTSAGWCRGARCLLPCTPSGVIEMLDRSGIAIAGARAVVIGRSEIVGKPMAMLLLQRDATVTICHSKTPDLPAVCADGRHPRRGDRPSRLRHAGVRQAGRHRDRRRHHRG